MIVQDGIPKQKNNKREEQSEEGGQTE